MSTLSILRPDELRATWQWIELSHRRGEISDDRAARWKLGLIGLMRFWDMALEELTLPAEHSPDIDSLLI